MSLTPSKWKALKVLFSQLSILSPLVLVHWWPRWSKHRLTSPRCRRAGPRCSCGGDGSVAFAFSSSVGFHGRSLTFSKPAAACAAKVWCCRAGCLQKCSCPALVPLLQACGRWRFGAGHERWTGWEGRAGGGTALSAGGEGCPRHSSHRRRFEVGKEVGTASLGPWRDLLPEETQKAERRSTCPLPLQ